jgi:FixJ family two-component response regulator
MTTNEMATVYIVDDDPDVRASLDMLLKSVGIKTHTFSDADTFLNNHKRITASPSCLLLDVRMPGISGMTALEKLHNERVRLPVIILTGHGDIPMSVRAMKMGAVDFITKPFNHQKLLELVQSILRDPFIQGEASPPELDRSTGRSGAVGSDPRQDGSWIVDTDRDGTTYPRPRLPLSFSNL